MYYKHTATSFQESGLLNLGQGECLYNRLAREKIAKATLEEEKGEKDKEKKDQAKLLKTEPHPKG